MSAVFAMSAMVLVYIRPGKDCAAQRTDIESHKRTSAQKQYNILPRSLRRESN